MNDKRYKEISIKEFTKAASVYETNQAGVYKMCKKDYPDVLAELEKEPFESLSINSSVLSFLYSPTLTSIHDQWQR